VSETAHFEIIRSEKTFELRQYPPILIAKVLLSGPFETAYKSGGDILKDYLDGNNYKQVKLAETIAPIATPSKATPYMMKSRPEGWEVSCVLPGHLSCETAPRPVEQKIHFEELASRPVAVFKFTGKAPYSFIMKKTEELRSWAKSSDLKLNSTSRIVVYKSGFLPFLRKNEIQLDGVFS